MFSSVNELSYSETATSSISNTILLLGMKLLIVHDTVHACCHHFAIIELKALDQGFNAVAFSLVPLDQYAQK